MSVKKIKTDKMSITEMILLIGLRLQKSFVKSSVRGENTFVQRLINNALGQHYI